MKKILTISTLCLGLTLAPQIHAAKLYKWVDENGVVSYQDTPPPKGRKILQESTIKKSSVNSNRTLDNEDKDPIKIYRVSDCNLCDVVRQHLKTLEVPLIELPLQDDRKAQDLILERSDSLTVPTIFIGEQMIQGGDLGKLEEALQNNGYELSKPEPETESNTDPGATEEDQEAQTEG